MGGGVLEPQDEKNSPLCEAGPCGLRIDRVTVTETSATVITSGGVGVLSYSLDEGASAQSSNRFLGLYPGTYTVTVLDDANADCLASQEFSIVGAQTEPPAVEPPPSLVPAGISLVRRTVWEQVSTYPAGTLVRLELFVETEHNRRDYANVYSAQKVADQSGTVNFQLDKVLRDRLAPQLPPLEQPATVFEPQLMLNYFTQTRAVDELTNELGKPTRRPLRAALLSGLDMRGQFLSTAPPTRRLAGPLYGIRVPDRGHCPGHRDRGAHANPARRHGHQRE